MEQTTTMYAVQPDGPAFPMTSAREPVIATSPVAEPEVIRARGRAARMAGGVNWGALATITVLHAALFFALVALDIVPLHKKAKALHMIDLKALPEVSAPPPPPPPPSQPQPPQVIAPAPVLTAPPQIVPTPAPAAMTAPPPPPVPTAEVEAPPAPPAPAAAPVSAPSADVGDFGNVAPRYPAMSLRLREQGVVRLRVVIDAEGRVRDIAVAKGSGFGRLDQAALDGIRKWRFHPGRQNGQAVDGAVGFLNYTFALRG